MTVQTLLDRLERVHTRGADKFLARCPAHQDRSPSLSIREVDHRILLHCFAGCAPETIVSALGLEMHDLFLNTKSSQGQPLTPRPQKLDLVDVAFRFELAALDRRLRAKQVLIAVVPFTGESLEDMQRDRLMNAVAKAYHDIERAELFEAVADDLRMKVYEERMASHAA